MLAKLDTDTITGTIIGCGIGIHQKLGPGLPEAIYEKCLAHDLIKAGLKVESQRPMNVEYDGLIFKNACRLDLIVADCVIVELKAVEAIHPIHRAQLLTYLRLMNLKTGLLINFNVQVLTQGVSRVVLF